MRVRTTSVRLTGTTSGSGKPSKSSSGALTSDAPNPEIPPSVAASAAIIPPIAIAPIWLWRSMAHSNVE